MRSIPFGYAVQYEAIFHHFTHIHTWQIELWSLALEVFYFSFHKRTFQAFVVFHFYFVARFDFSGFVCSYVLTASALLAMGLIMTGLLFTIL